MFICDGQAKIEHTGVNRCMNNHNIKAIIQRFAAIPTSTLSDVLDSFGISGVLREIHAIAPNMKVVGPAVTVKEITGNLGSYSLEDFRVGEIIQEAGRGDVLIVDNGGECVSTWGFLASLSSKVRGLAGVVVDGGVRDVRQVCEIDFPVFARHVVPISGKKRIKIESINTAIRMQDVNVEPEDIIVGDDTGVIVVPQKKSLEILDEAERIECLEQKYVPQIQFGTSLSDLAREHSHV